MKFHPLAIFFAAMFAIFPASYAQIPVLAGLIAVRPAAVGRPATRPIDPQIASARQRMESLPLLGRFKPGQFLEITGGVVPSVRIGDALRRPGQHRIEVEGSDATWVVYYFAAAPAAARNTAPSLTVTLYDFAQAEHGGTWQASIRALAEGFHLNARSGSGATMTLTSFLCTPAQARLTVSGLGVGNGRVITAAAPTLRDFRAQHPLEYRQHVAPLLRKLTGSDPLRPRSGDIYRVFTDIPADPAVSQRLLKILDGLESIAPAEREQASAHLDALGDAGVLALLRFDRSHLSPEQDSRVDRFLRQHTDGRWNRHEEALADLGFLLDCLEFEDPAVRAAATRALSRAVGRPIDFDPALNGPVRTAAVDRLRESLLRGAATRPASTSPAARPDVRH